MPAGREASAARSKRPGRDLEVVGDLERPEAAGADVVGAERLGAAAVPTAHAQDARAHASVVAPGSAATAIGMADRGDGFVGVASSSVVIGRSFAK